MFEELTKKFSIAFEQQFHYACFYAYIKIKEQEIKNIVWFDEIPTIQKPCQNRCRQVSLSGSGNRPVEWSSLSLVRPYY